jgi:hypothetical protein
MEEGPVALRIGFHASHEQFPPSRLLTHNLSDQPRTLNLRRLAGDEAHHLELEFADGSKWGVEPVADEDVELPGYGYRWLRGFTHPTNNPLP